jgi:hypothetical protein
MREIREKPTVWREVAAAGKDPAAEPGTGFVLQTGKIPPPDMGPVRRPAAKHGND